MEQDIKNLQEIINLCNEELDNKDENVTAVLDLTDLLSLRNLIKAYKELEEENKTLNERNQYLVKYRAKLEKELYESNKNYIPVSLVEEKIEELNKKEKELQNSISDEEREEYSDANISYQLMDIEIKRSVLQELLEKRK